MDEAVRQRLFGWQRAFDHPATIWLSGGILSVLLLAIVIVLALRFTDKLSDSTYHELKKRVLSWCVLAPLMVGPVLLGAACTMGAVALLSLLCFREFSRATGLFRERLVSGLVVLCMLAMTFATFDHWYGLFTALIPLGVVLIAGFAVIADQPTGYIQRTALGIFSLVFFGACFGHLAYFANDVDYRPMVLLLLVAVELNDVFAYVSGRLFGRRKLLPNTSPNKTWAGAIGAMILSMGLVLLCGPLVFAGTVVNQTNHLVTLGVIISIGGQLGDLMLSSIKRDLGIKDFAATIPGHGGLLDRFDSLLLVAPAAFHYIGYLRGIGLYEPQRIFSGG
tara:strand:+ start:1238 stop:2242 length:1005 start_codon:yes stop_codon:yes gene_type:complete